MMKKVLVLMAFGLFCGSLFAAPTNPCGAGCFDYESCRKSHGLAYCIVGGIDCKADAKCRCSGSEGCLPGLINVAGTPEHAAYTQATKGKVTSVKKAAQPVKQNIK